MTKKINQYQQDIWDTFRNPKTSEHQKLLILAHADKTKVINKMYQKNMAVKSCFWRKNNATN